MDFQFGWGGTKTFCRITPTHPISSHVEPSTRTTMLMQGGIILQQIRLHIFANCEINNAKGDLCMFKRKLLM
jgi:hypothetical protein